MEILLLHQSDVDGVQLLLVYGGGSAHHQVLGVVMFFIIGSFRELALDAMVWKAAKCLLWEAALALLAHFGVMLTATAVFDRKGNFRRKKK